MTSRSRVMIFGADGQLGRRLSESLGEAGGWELYGSDRDTLDITDTAAVRAHVRRIRPGWVINCAAITSVDLCERDPSTSRVNADVVAHIASACGEVGARIVQISTDFVFDGTSRSPYREDDPTGPLNVYARDKLQAEIHARAVEHHLIVRTAWLFGPGGNNFVAAILARASTGMPVRVVDDQVGSPSYTVDIAAGIMRLMTIDARGTYHVVNSGQATWHELASRAVQLVGLNAPVEAISTAAYGGTVRRPAFSVLDCGKYTSATGHRLRSWSDALEDYLRAGR